MTPIVFAFEGTASHYSGTIGISDPGFVLGYALDISDGDKAYYHLHALYLVQLIVIEYDPEYEPSIAYPSTTLLNITGKEIAGEYIPQHTGKYHFLIFQLETPAEASDSADSGIRYDICKETPNDRAVQYARLASLVFMTSIIMLLLIVGHLRVRGNHWPSQEAKVLATWRYLVSKWDYWIPIFLGALIFLVMTVISELDTYFYQSSWVLEIISTLVGGLLTWGAIFAVWFATKKRDSI